MAEPKVSYVVRGPMCWGTGPTPAAALRRCRQEWSETYAGKYSKKRTDCHKITADEWSIGSVDGSIGVDGGGKIEVVWKKEEKK